MHPVLNLDNLRDQLDQRLHDALTRPDDEVTLKQRRRLAAARDRLDLGLFGTCCACKEEISPAVITADPSSPFCSDCQEGFDFRRLGR